MNGRTVWGAGLVLAGLMTTPAAAQEKGDIGLTISAPSALGVIWHVSERVAVRPEMSFSFSETDAESSTLTDVSSHSFTLAGSALFYMGRWESLQTYFSPRLTYSWAGSSTEAAGLDIESTQNGWGLSGSLGAQYTLGTRFAVFAEAGLMYSSSESKITTILPTDRTSWAFGSRTAIGGTLYF
jgi:hypothetical protein